MQRYSVSGQGAGCTQEARPSTVWLGVRSLYAPAPVTAGGSWGVPHVYPAKGFIRGQLAGLIAPKGFIREQLAVLIDH